MKTTPSTTNAPANWRNLMVGSSVYRNRGVYPGGIDSVTIGSTHPKAFTATTNGRPTRRGAPPH